MKSTLDDTLGLSFDNRFLRAMPADPVVGGGRRQVFEACYSHVEPTPVKAPRLVAYSPEVADALGLSAATCRSDAFAQVFAGNQLIEGMTPTAACYGGHQFGHWAGQLGDGRAISLGEALGQDGHHLELQLKGAGPTPYSRMGDGRAVLRSSVREFLCSEAMHHLGVPTTRALSLVLTGDSVVRDMFYDGRPQAEPGAIVCRIAPTFLRFGSFEIFTARGDDVRLKALLDYVVRTYYPELGEPGPDTYLAWFDEVCRRTLDCVDHWMRVGFVHGVMNSDNMSILGQTIDYGPYGWLEPYDPRWTPNTTDAQGRRYCFGQQLQIGLWNLACLANAIFPAIKDDQGMRNIFESHAGDLERRALTRHAAKLGLMNTDDDDQALIDDHLKLLEGHETDFTRFYRALADVPIEPEAETSRLDSIRGAFYGPPLRGNMTRSWERWLERWAQRVARQPEGCDERRARMNAINPKYVLRNYLAQVAIDEAERGTFDEIERLLHVMRSPYAEQPEHDKYASLRPEWARDRPGCSTLSCSS